MPDRRHIKISKTLSRILRHAPDSVGLALDEAGWADVEELRQALRRAGQKLSRFDIDQVVAGSDKQRFEFSPDGARIRARQGHSIEVNLGYEPCEPPALLFHGTAKRNIESIRASGLIKGARQGHSIEVNLGYEPCEPPALLFHGTAKRNIESIRASGLIKGARHSVHLSPDEKTATKVGQRHGKPVVLIVRAGEMYSAGMAFMRTGNNVWLTDHVPPEYIDLPGEPRIELCAGGVVVRCDEGDDGSPRAEALLIRMRDAGYELPKGHVEAGETLADAAARETYEETGLATALPVGCELGAITYSFERKGRARTKRVRYFRMAAAPGQALAFAKLPKGTCELLWVDAERALEVDLISESLREIIVSALSGTEAGR